MIVAPLMDEEGQHGLSRQPAFPRSGSLKCKSRPSPPSIYLRPVPSPLIFLPPVVQALKDPLSTAGHRSDLILGEPAPMASPSTSLLKQGEVSLPFRPPHRFNPRAPRDSPPPFFFAPTRIVYARFLPRWLLSSPRIEFQNFFSPRVARGNRPTNSLRFQKPSRRVPLALA